MKFSPTTAGALPRQAQDLTGQRFGMLTALRPGKTNGHKRWWVFRCDCGNEREKCGVDVKKDLRNGRWPNCGCMTKALQSRARVTHGMSKHPAYAVWRSMNDRCRLPSHQAWANYGGRGIRVCERWQASFENFWQDVGAEYRRGLEIDRCDNNGDYEPGNTRWTVPLVQHNNRRDNVRIPTPSGPLTLSQASRRYGIGETTLQYRVANNWPVDRLLIEPNVANRGFSTSSTVARGPAS